MREIKSLLSFIRRGGYESEDCAIALQAAEAMASRLNVDVAIMPDLSVVPADNALDTPLEVIRASPPAVKINGTRRWKPDEIQAWAESKRER